MKRTSWVYVLAAVLAAGVGFLIREPVREYLVRPFLDLITRISFTLGIYWRTQDQELIWGGFILTAIVLVAASLRELRSEKDKRRRVPLQVSGRLRFWADELETLHESTYYQWRFCQQVGRLLLNKVGLDEGETADEIHQQLQDDRLILPEDIKQFLKATYKTKLHEYYFFQENRENPGTLPYITPERIAEYLE